MGFSPPPFTGILALQGAVSAVPTLPGNNEKRLVGASGQNAVGSMAFDGNFLYVGLKTSPGVILKVNPTTLMPVGIWTGITGQNWVQALYASGSSKYIYAALNIGPAPGQVVKIDPGTMTTVATWTGAAGESLPRGLALSGNSLYTGLNGLGGARKIDTLTMASDGAPWVSVALPSCITFDGTYLYVGVIAFPGASTVVQIDANTMVATGSVWTGTPAQNNIQCLDFDGTNIYAGFVENPSPAEVVQIDIPTMTTLATWTGAADQLWAAAIAHDGTSIYVGLYSQPGQVVKVDPTTMLTISSWVGESGEDYVSALAFNTTTGKDLYAGLTTSPFTVLDIDPATMTTRINLNIFAIDSLAGKGDTAFQNWSAYIAWQHLGLDGAPQNELQSVNSYLSNDGIFVTPAFSVPPAVEDIIILVHPAIAAAIATGLELESTSLVAGAGSIAGGSRVGKLLRYIADNLAASSQGVVSAVTPGSKSTTWQLGEATLVSIGAIGDHNNITTLKVDISALQGNITIKMYEKVNGVEKQTWPPAPLTWNVANGDSPAVALINGNYEIDNVLRVTIQSDNPADNGASVGYEYALTKVPTASAPPAPLGNLDVAVSTRAAPGQIIDDATPFHGASIAAILAKANTLPADTTNQLDVNIPAIKTQTDKFPNQLFRAVQPASTYTARIAITAAGGSQALGSITVAGLPAGAILAYVFMHLKFGGRENTNVAANSISGAQNIQAKKDAGAYATGIALAGGEYATVASSGVVAGDVILGTTDLVGLGLVNGSVVTFQWTTAKAAQNNLNINDIQMILEIWYTL